MKKVYRLIMPVIIGALAILIVAGLLLIDKQDDQVGENSIFEDIS